MAAETRDHFLETGLFVRFGEDPADRPTILGLSSIPDLIQRLMRNHDGLPVGSSQVVFQPVELLRVNESAELVVHVEIAVLVVHVRPVDVQEIAVEHHEMVGTGIKGIDGLLHLPQVHDLLFGAKVHVVVAKHMVARYIGLLPEFDEGMGVGAQLLQLFQALAGPFATSRRSHSSINLNRNHPIPNFN